MPAGTVKRNDLIISARLLIKLVLLLFLIALIGMALEILNLRFRKYFAYVAIPLGAMTTIVGAVLAMFGKVNNDLNGEQKGRRE